MFVCVSVRKEKMEATLPGTVPLTIFTVCIHMHLQKHLTTHPSTKATTHYLQGSEMCLLVALHTIWPPHDSDGAVPLSRGGGACGLTHIKNREINFITELQRKKANREEVEIHFFTESRNVSLWAPIATATASDVQREGARLSAGRRPLMKLVTHPDPLSPVTQYYVHTNKCKCVACLLFT